MSIGAVAVARKRPGPGGGGKTPRGPSEGEPKPEVKPTLVSIKGNVEWREWLERLAKFDRMSVVGVIDRALVHYARHISFTEEPPDR